MSLVPSGFGTDEFRSLWDPDQLNIVYTQRPTQSSQALCLGTGQTGVAIWCEGVLDLQFTHSGYLKGDYSIPSQARLSIRLEEVTILSTEARLDLRSCLVEVTHQTTQGEIRALVIADRSTDLFTIEIRAAQPIRSALSVLPTWWRAETEPQVRSSAVLLHEQTLVTQQGLIDQRAGSSSSKEDPAEGLRSSIRFQVSGETPMGPLQPLFITDLSGPVRCTVGCSSGKKSFEELDQELIERMEPLGELTIAQLRLRDRRFWDAFWQRSYITLGPDSPLEPLRANWYLHRFFCACSMEGAFPPKFNGSVFLGLYDQRYWGGAYWFQNMRLLYWPLLKSGDYSYIWSWLDIYIESAEYQRRRVSSTYGHEGIIYPETMHLWGAARYEDCTDGRITNPYIISYFGGSLELIHLACCLLDHGFDELRAPKVLDLGLSILEFFVEHFPRDQEGRLSLEHSSALETWWDCDDPADQIAGLMAVCDDLSLLNSRLGADHSTWIDEVKTSLPPLPTGILVVQEDRIVEVKEGIGYLPARRFHHSKKENYEDPELYALWPYELSGLDEEAMQSSFDNRLHQRPLYGWSQTAIWAARLGRAEEAAALALEHLSHSGRFPGGMHMSPGYMSTEDPRVSDCPYFDAQGALATAFEMMLLQDHREGIEYLPAWPIGEEVAFRFHTRSGPVTFGPDQHENQ